MYSASNVKFNSAIVSSIKINPSDAFANLETYILDNSTDLSRKLRTIIPLDGVKYAIITYVLREYRMSSVRKLCRN